MGADKRSIPAWTGLAVRVRYENKMPQVDPRVGGVGHHSYPHPSGYPKLPFLATWLKSNSQTANYPAEVRSLEQGPQEPG